jgi:hypothetical protein
MSHYQERLDAFAAGRRFARMRRPVRNRADSWCDACGSVQARLLFGVKDERSGEVYFVGEHCLQELAERGVVVRRFLRESAEDAYALRCASRGEATAAMAQTMPEPGQSMPVSPESGEPAPGTLTALLVLGAPAAMAGAPGKVISLSLAGEPAAQTVALLATWPDLRAQLLAIGLDGPST